jgi:hypothetical protein
VYCENPSFEGDVHPVLQDDNDFLNLSLMKRYYVNMEMILDMEGEERSDDLLDSCLKEQCGRPWAVTQINR